MLNNLIIGTLKQTIKRLEKENEELREKLKSSKTVIEHKHSFGILEKAGQILITSIIFFLLKSFL